MRKLLLINLIWLWLIPEAMAQQQVSGKITDYSNGEPLPGVNILVQGTGTGTITDIDGNYRLDVAGPDAVLSFSFIGYEGQEVTVGDQANINVALMPDLQTLDEVVVVGYGTMKKRDLTSAHTSIGSEEIQKTVNTTVEQAIQGRAAGVYVTQNTGQPGGGVSVNIRGINSITGSNEPLYVIDGVQIAPSQPSYGVSASTNPLAGLNPADIATMSILQGPSATAIYGSRGTNGVVLITTKRGKAGETKFTYGYSYSLQEKPDNIPVMNLPQYAQMTLEYHELAGGDPPQAFLDPTILGPGTNWQDALFKTAPLHKHNLSLSGGSEKTQYYLGGEYFDQEGIAIGSSFNRYSLTLNVDNETNDWLKVGTNLNVYQTKEDIGTTQEDVIKNALQLSPAVPVRMPDGSWGGPDEINNSSLQFTPLNPVAIASLVENTYQRRGGRGALTAEVDIFKGLVFRTSLSGRAEYYNSHYFIPTYSLGNKVNDVASVREREGNETYWNWNQLLQYNTKIGKHEIGVMISHEAQESNWRYLEGARNNFVSNDLPVVDLGDAASATNDAGQGDWAMESYLGRFNYTFNEKYIVQAAIRADGSANFGPVNKWGYFPSVSAAWRVSEEPFLNNVSLIDELKLRFETGLTGNQGSSGRIYSPLKTAATPWGTGYITQRYGNRDLAWEETMTYNAGINLSLFNNRLQFEADFYHKETNNLLLDNPLPWYMGTEGEGNIDKPTVNIGALENRGYGITINTVNLDRNGFTWTSNLNFSQFKTEITKFYSDAAFVDRTAWYFGDFTQRATVGESPWLFRGYIYEGLFQSVEEIHNSALPTDAGGAELEVDVNGIWVGDIKYKDLNEDGIIDERDQTYIGNPWPKLTTGFTNEFSYKGFNLSILVTGSFGNDIFNYTRHDNTNPNNINLGRNMLEETFGYAKIAYSTEDVNTAYILNSDTDIPRISSGVNGNFNRFTDKFVEDGSYIRIKNITLGYNLPESLLGRQKIVKGARVSLGVQNIATFTKYKGYDPEVGAYVGREVQAQDQLIGVDYGRYPITPMYTFSVGLDF